MGDIQEVQLSVAEIEQALEHSPEFFAHFFLGKQMEVEQPQFHRDILFDMTNEDFARVVECLPRGHAKTTYARLCVVWHILFSKKRFCVYLASTVTLAIPSTNVIMSMLTSDNCIAVFGSVGFVKQQEGIGHYEFWFRGTYYILHAHGAGQAIRGLNIDSCRPQLVVVDDLEDDKLIATQRLRMELRKWLYGPFLKCLDEFSNKIVWLANLTTKDQILYDLLHDESWHSRRYACIKANGESLWPALWPLDKLIKDYLSYEKAGMADIWLAEMMNMPVAAGGAVIEADEITYMCLPNPEDTEYCFITVDLALSDKTWADNTTISVHARLTNEYTSTGGELQLVVSEAYRGMDPIQLLDRLIELCEYWRVSCVAIENVAYQASLQTIYPHMLREKGIFDIHIVELFAVGKKAARIISWAGLIKSGRYVLTHGDMATTEELLNYEPAKRDNKDDRIDGAAYAYQAETNYMEFILAARTIQAVQKANGTYETCGV